METIRLNELLKGICECRDERVVCGISDHSDDIKKDWLFVVRHGEDSQSEHYIEKVLAQGGIVLFDRDIKKEHVYVCNHVEYHVRTLLDRFYGALCETICVIGVTGTSGKTSVASIISQLLMMDQREVMQIGTLFLKYHDVEEKTMNTTPGCFQLSMYFHKAKQLHIPYVVMEVSSHAIDQDRINFIQFDMILYTNIREDHLDYHLTKTHYRYTKFKLRRYLKANGAILYNNDLPYMQELLHLAHYQCLCFGTGEAHYPIRDIQLEEQGSSFSLQGFHYHTSLLGMMSVYNMCEAMMALRRLHVPYETLQTYVAQVKTIPGRMERIEGKGYEVWLDYAHTSDALANLLQFAKYVKRGRLLCVIGCGGNRDKTKRPQMASIAARYSDIALFTSDNPRYEPVYEILADMCVEHYPNVEVFENRYYALKHVVKIAQKSDIIVIAGKGNEEYISVCGEQYPFSDRVILQELIAKEDTRWN